MRNGICFIFLGTAALCFASAAQELRDIEWQTPGYSANAATTASVESVVTGEQGRHVVLQFEEIPVQEEKDKLAAKGVHLLTYLGSKAFFAKLDDNAVTADVSAVSAAASIQLDWKLHPMLARGEYPEFAYFNTSEIAKEDRASIVSENAPDKDILAVYIIFHPDVDLVNDGAVIVYGHGGTIRDTMDAINGVVAWIPASELASIASEDAVQWIEPPLPPFSTTNAENRVRTQADTVNAAPYSLNGSGIDVLVYDGGTARATHTDFSGRLTVRDASGQHYHPTHVAGTIGGDGTTTLNNRGMAPAVTMQSYGFEYDGTGSFLYSNPGDINSDYNAAINTYGSVIANNSIGTNTAPNGFPCEWEGDYG
ncbi:MAG: S8 family serine peptidase, partial [Rhodocyclaceae bacterium]|nr:S8 family serine peptidase [Rhodocyclaceae bacterium]